MSNGYKLVEIALKDGIAKGTISNNKGELYRFNREKLQNFSLICEDYKDLEGCGLYLLFDNSEKCVYVGESEKLLGRLKQHLRDENYWNTFICFRSEDINDKSMCKYIENILIKKFKNSENFILKNTKNSSDGSVLSQVRKSIAEEFVESFVEVILDVLGINVLNNIRDIELSSSTNDLFALKTKNYDAKGFISINGFTVIEGSVINKKFNKSLEKNLPHNVVIRDNLLKDKIVDNNTFKFLKSFEFSSPSSAASVVTGSPKSGKSSWKNKDGKTINDIENNI